MVGSRSRARYTIFAINFERGWCDSGARLSSFGGPQISVLGHQFANRGDIRYGTCWKSSSTGGVIDERGAHAVPVCFIMTLRPFSFSFYMAPALALKVLLEFLRTVRFARDYVERFPRRAASLLAFVGRKLNLWWRFWLGNLGSAGRPKPADRPFLGTEASSHSVSGGSAVAREYVVAASFVPAPGGHQSLRVHTDSEREPETSAHTIGVDPRVVVSPSIDHPQDSSPSHPLGRRGLVISSSLHSSGSPGGVNVQSRASDRFSIITDSPESIGTPVGQKSQLFIAASSSPTHHPPSPSPSAVNAIRRRGSPTNVALNVQNSSPGSLTADPHDETKSSNPATSNYSVPKDHVVRLIDSEEIPRYTKDIKMQVGYTTL